MAMMGGGGMGGGWGPGGAGGGRRGDLAASDSMLDQPFDWADVGYIGAYVRPYLKQAVISALLIIVYALGNVLNPYLIGLGIDLFIGRGDLQGLMVVVGGLLVVNVGMWAAQYWQVWLMSFVGQNVLFKISHDMFVHLQRLSLAFFDHNEVGRIMSRLQSDVAVLENTLISGILSMLASLVSLVGIVAAMAVLNGHLALLAFSVMPVMIVFTVFWQRLAQRSFRRTRASISVVNATLQEYITGARVVQSLAREERSSREFADVNGRNLASNLDASRVSALILPMIEVLAAAAIALVVIVGGMEVAQGREQIGVLVAFTLYINRFFDPIRDLAQQYNQLQRTAVAVERIVDLLQTPPEVVDRLGAIELPTIHGDVWFKQVGFAYGDGPPILHSLSLRVDAGQMVALVGSTGAGKSTVASLLLRLYDVQGGAVTIDGYDVRDVTQQSLRRQIGMVLQEPYLFSGTVRQNIQMGCPAAAADEVEAAARSVGAHEVILTLAHGYETIVGERGGNLSPGQRQLISFARALLANPRILVLDEATANLDSFTERRVQMGLQQLLANRTSLVIAHRLSTVREADRIVVLEAGAIVEDGTHGDLMALGGRYAHLYRMGDKSVGAL